MKDTNLEEILKELRDTKSRIDDLVDVIKREGEKTRRQMTDQILWSADTQYARMHWFGGYFKESLFVLLGLLSIVGFVSFNMLGVNWLLIYIIAVLALAFMSHVKSNWFFLNERKLKQSFPSIPHDN